MLNLSPAQTRALAALAEDITAKVRPDVLKRLQLANAVVVREGRPVRLTDEGAATVEARPVLTPDAAPLRVAVDPGALGVYLANNVPADAPQGTAQALAAALADLTDRERVAVLAFLAAPAGAAFLGQVKDELVAVNRLGRTYAETAEVLGLSVTAINKAVSRRAARGIHALTTRPGN